MKKCFSVMFVIIFVIQEPSLSKANYFERDVYRSRQAYMYSATEKAVNFKDIESDDVFRIQYYLNGGTFLAGSPAEYRPDDLPVVPKQPVREGYNFSGWYTDSSFSHKIHQIDEDSIGNYQLYAKWTRCINNDYSVQMYSYPNTKESDSANKKLRNLNYDFLRNVKIPGMPSTKEADVYENRIMDTSQCPQGICTTDEYLVVSAYSSGSESLGCIYIFDRTSGEYLVSLGLKKYSHLGGITFDGENVWVCHSQSSSLECIPYSYIRQTASRKQKSLIDCTKMFEEYHVLNVPSCIAYYDGRLWVATHTKFLNSKMAAYKITENGLRQVKSCRIPDKVQGIAFDEAGKVYISTSYGRTKSSYLKIYHSIDALHRKPDNPMLKIEMPPCAEEIALTDGSLYVLFESAGEKYFEGTDGKGRSVAPIEEVLVLSQSSIF